ncbi:mandelate racemase/muconate lactonizing enzyme family protein [Actinopolymorpha sp. B17G11]|uniref:mandelate racemase/muconate lactonizing enzyme family protein n=1 Tax=Actinopolymorpha sp. B17G11 TaxID=3160861 RepID=UPI0032E4BE5B
MKITAVETVVPDLNLSRPFVFVLVRTDEGVTGLGQTADVRTIGVLRDLAERFLIGADPRRSTLHWHEMFDWSAYHGYAGAESRAISALDIALWDIRGQLAGQPIGSLLGGPVRESVPIYNTCGAYAGNSDGERARRDPVGLAEELLAAGITCMKVAPFERFIVPSRGALITKEQLAEGVAGIEKIAAALGDRMEVMVEAHGLLSPNVAAQVVVALDGLPVRWIEDPIAQDNTEEWVRLREKSTVPIAGGERLQTRHQLRRLIEHGGVDVVISDITWCGGITETKRVADLAELHGVPLATHGNSGPVNLWSAAHLLTSIPNAYMAETVRVQHDPTIGYFHKVVDGPSILTDGHLNAPTAPGLGITLRDDFPTLTSSRGATG